MLLKPFEIKPLNRHYDGAYDETAMRWRTITARDKAANIEVLLGGREVERVLEVGCGTGAVLAQLAQRNIGHSHVGVDLSDPQGHIHPDADGLDLRQYDGSRLPFDDDSFDLVYATHVVEHVYNPRPFLEELTRVSGKYVYIEVPCEIGIRTRRSALQASLDTGHINGYTPEYFMILLQSVGMNVSDMRLFDHSLDVIGFKNSRLKAKAIKTLRAVALHASPNLASKLFCYHCGALALKSSGTAKGD